MCHMLADTLEELHAMADKLALKRSRFQPLSSPHYDITWEMRADAVRLGAVEVDRRGIVAVIRRLRAKKESSAKSLDDNVRDFDRGGL